MKRQELSAAGPPEILADYSDMVSQKKVIACRMEILS